MSIRSRKLVLGALSAWRAMPAWYVLRGPVKKKSTVTRFELVRAEPNHLAGGHLNHSAKLSRTLIVVAERSQGSTESEDGTSVDMDVTEELVVCDESPGSRLFEEP